MEGLSRGKVAILGMQHVLAMFGATILVPMLTGLDISVALFTSAVGTLLFQLITKGEVPAYLGSSFAFIGPIIAAKEGYGVSAALGGIIVAGLVYLLASAVIRHLGVDVVRRYLPPVVVGPVIISIGLSLAPVAKDMAESNLWLAFFTLAVTIVVSTFAKGFFRVLPILIGVSAGYVLAIILGLVDFSGWYEAAWLGVPAFVRPSFSLPAITIIAPVALATMVEHLGDVLALGRTTGKDFTKKPGLHRTMLGDGVATLFAGLFGGPPNTTYGENIGVLAITKVYDPKVIRVAAIFVLILSFVPKLSIVIGAIPAAVMGGIVILLFGMIAAVGIRTLIENQVDLSNTRNLIILSTIMVIGVGKLQIDFGLVSLEGTGLAAIAGILLNIVLPREKEDVREEAMLEAAATKD